MPRHQSQNTALYVLVTNISVLLFTQIERIAPRRTISTTMDTAAPFIVRGEFVYHDALFVDVGGALKRHARASPSDLKTYLDGKAPKDQVAHFYEAQLIHYGLQRSRDKNTAKVRLQQALSQQILVVPPHIVEMEAQMQKDYAASIRKARNSGSQVSKGDEVDGRLTPGKKRKQSDTNLESAAAANKKTKTKTTMKVGDVEVSIDHRAAGPAGKKAPPKKSKASSKTVAAFSSLLEGRAINSPTPTPVRRQAVSHSLSEASSLTTAENIHRPTATPTRNPTTTPQHSQTPRSEDVLFPPFLANKSLRAVQSPDVRPTVSSPQKRAPKLEPKVKKEPPANQWSLTRAPAFKTKVQLESKVKREPSASPWSPSKPSTRIKDEVKPESDAVDGPESRLITGVYKVSSRQLEEQYPHDASKLRFFLCVDNEAGKLWGGFELASKSGVLCIKDDYTGTNGPLSFGWRARDSNQGRLSFGKGCFGKIQFFDDRSFKATVSNMFSGREPVELEGVRRPGPIWCGKSAWQFEREWDGFVAEAYGR
jgi:hypothetical protein